MPDPDLLLVGRLALTDLGAAPILADRLDDLGLERDATLLRRRHTRWLLCRGSHQRQAERWADDARRHLRELAGAVRAAGGRVRYRLTVETGGAFREDRLMREYVARLLGRLGVGE